MKRSIAAVITLALAAVTALGACAASKPSVCDPITIEVEGKCYWDQPSACDAAQCNPPHKCTVVEDKPAHVECERAEGVPPN